jgi:hypothetical protein
MRLGSDVLLSDTTVYSVMLNIYGFKKKGYPILDTGSITYFTVSTLNNVRKSLYRYSTEFVNTAEIISIVSEKSVAQKTLFLRYQLCNTFPMILSNVSVNLN